MYCITNLFELYLQLEGQLLIYSSHFQERLLLLKGNRRNIRSIHILNVENLQIHHYMSHIHIHVFLFLVLQS